MPEAETFNHARRDRDDVLQRAADLDPDDIVAAVQAKIRPAKFALDDFGARLVRRCDAHRGRQLVRHLDRKARTR